MPEYLKITVNLVEVLGKLIPTRIYGFIIAQGANQFFWNLQVVDNRTPVRVTYNGKRRKLSSNGNNTISIAIPKKGRLAKAQVVELFFQ